MRIIDEFRTTAISTVYTRSYHRLLDSHKELSSFDRPHKGENEGRHERGWKAHRRGIVTVAGQAAG